MPKKVIVTIPAYNEERTIGPVIEDIISVMKKTKYRFEVMVVNDGSRDRTKQVAEAAGATVVSHPRNCGLAEAFRTEMKETAKRNADIIVHTDADGQYLAKDIPRLIRQVERGYDLVLGSRFRGKIEEMALMKRIGNIAFSVVISNICRTRISDCQTGFRAFTRDFAQRVVVHSTHTYTQEQIIRAVKQKFRIKEIPVFFAKRGGGTTSRLMSGPFEYAIKAWINILRVIRDHEPIKFFGVFGGVFIMLGILAGIPVTWNFLQFGNVGGHIPLIILTALLIGLGFQILLFGFLADLVNRQ